MPPLRADHSPKKLNQSIGGLIRGIRQFRLMSQRDLAARTFLRPDSLSKYESGTHPPNVRALYRLAQALAVPIDCFFPELAFESPVDRNLYVFFRQLWFLPLESKSTIATLLSCLVTFNQTAPAPWGNPRGEHHGAPGR